MEMGRWPHDKEGIYWPLVRTGTVFVAKPEHFANLGFNFRQHFADARFAQNASICADGEIEDMFNSKCIVPGHFLKVWIRTCMCCPLVVHTGLNQAFKSGLA
jgi:hypothetical protein